MRSTCPSCHAAYDIPDDLVGAGRRVRCANCDETWRVTAPRDNLAEPSPPPVPDDLEPEPEPAPERQELVLRRAPAIPQVRMEEIPQHEGSRAALAGWAVTVVVLVVAGTAAVTWRDAIMLAWPPSARAYAALGLGPVNGGSGASR